MANRLTIRFYSVEKAAAAGLSLQHALENLDAVHPRSGREVQLAGGYIVRLERYENDAGELAGEFTRVQTTDYPFEVDDDGVSPLPTDRPIGDGIAFRYRPADATLAIQYDPRIISPGRVMDYLTQYDPRARYEMEPKIDPENWEKFLGGEVRKLTIGVASPDNLAELENEAAAASRTFHDLATAYGAPIIKIELGMGRRNGALLESTKLLAKSVLGLLTNSTGDVRSLKANVRVKGQERPEEINLIDEVISEKVELDLPANDPDGNYGIRRDFLKVRLSDYGE